jgi:hypothetical protein
MSEGEIVIIDWKWDRTVGGRGIGVSLDLGYLGFSAAFVEQQITNVSESLTDLVARARELSLRF